MLLVQRQVEGATALGLFFKKNLPYLYNNQVQVLASGLKWQVPSGSSPEETKGEKVDVKTPVLKFDITFNAEETVKCIEDTTCLSYVGTFLENKTNLLFYI